METWLSYSLHDLLIFSPESYIQLYELLNQALWPWHLVLIGLSTGALFFVQTSNPVYQRMLLLWLASIWVFVGHVFIGDYYSQIFQYADWFKLLFTMQAVLLVLFSIFPPNANETHDGKAWQTYAIWFLLIGGYFIYPMITALTWRAGIASLQIFAVAPDPTAIATLGFVVSNHAIQRKLALAIIPLLWIMFSVLTHLAFIG